jgi:DNA primase
MPLIPEGLIDDIQARTDIAELVGRYVPLKRAGRHFKGLCPFHKEKTPSFMVNADKQIFHCFGCGVGGNIFSFLMQHDRLTFPEAVRSLAEHAGVRLPEPDERAAGAGERAKSLAALMDKVCRYFERTLADPAAGRAARDYLAGRGVSEATRQAFRLGLAPQGWSRLLEAAQATKVSAEQLESAGLVIKGKSGYYDRFRSRLMFPIIDLRGRVVGFGGRSLEPRQEPKYLNSPETPLYTKGRHLFGLAQAREAVIAAKTAVVVEGYFDCVVLSGAGLAHVVSPLGTALTGEQARLLKRYAERVILAFDADAAGEQATLRGADLLVESGLQVRVAQLPQGVDPDEYLRARGRPALEQLLEQSLTLFEFRVHVALQRHPGSSTEDRVQAAQFVLPTIAKVPDAMMRSECVRLLSDRLRLDAGAVAEELAKTRPRGSAAPAASVSRLAARSAPAAPPGPERLLTALVLDEPSRWTAGTDDRLAIEEVTDPALRRLLTVVCELEAAGEPATPAQVISRVSGEGQAALVTALVELAQTVAAKGEAFADCVRRIRQNTERREQLLLREQLRAAETAGNNLETQRLVRLLRERQQRLASAPRQAGAVPAS